MSEILELKAVTKDYSKHKRALDGISLTLESGKITGLLGPNGSGKTTLIKLVNGLLRADSGEIKICGIQPSTETKAFVAYLPDSCFLTERMTVKQQVSYFADFFEDFRGELAWELLSRLNIKPEDKIKTLSKGNKEKVCLILTMSRSARLYLLDEPIAGVDPATRDYIINTIINNYNPDSSVLISTHLISDVENILEDVYFIKDGAIVYHNSVDALREETGKSVDEYFREVFKW